MKILCALMLWAAAASAQTAAFPATPITVPITINGTKVNITFTIPAQTLTCTGCGGSSGLPSGLTFSNGVFAVAGSISATTISLTSAPALPTCATNIFVFQLASGILTPVCLAAPAVTVSQAGTNSISVSPTL